MSSEITWQQAFKILWHHNLLANRLTGGIATVFLLLFWLLTWLTPLTFTWLWHHKLPFIIILLLNHFTLINLIAIKKIFGRTYKHFILRIEPK